MLTSPHVLQEVLFYSLPYQHSPLQVEADRNPIITERLYVNSDLIIIVGHELVDFVLKTLNLHHS